MRPPTLRSAVTTPTTRSDRHRRVGDRRIPGRAHSGRCPPRRAPDDEPLALPAYRHYRLLQRIHQPGTGQLSGLLAEGDQQAIRRPNPDVLQILDPRPLLDEAAAIGSRYRSAGLLVGETLAAGLTYGHQLWFGTQRNIGTRLAEIADDLRITVHVAEPG